MREVHYEIGETVGEVDGAVTYRAIRARDGRPVLLHVPRADGSHPRAAARLKNALEVGRLLKSKAVLEPLELESWNGSLALVLEDTEAVPLRRLLGAPFEIDRFLVVAIGIARALAELHQQRIVYRALSPESVLVHPETLDVQLADLGLASVLPRDTRAVSAPAVLEGALPYMAPEQTGRMNRSVDPRSDLYALGVLAFQLLTGQLPFTAGDPLAWIHAPPARPPPPPPPLNPAVPEVIARVVLTLLAKVAEDRYQSATGLLHDLSRCLIQLQASGRVAPFELRTEDVSRRFHVPEHLYGRSRERETLLAALERVSSSGSPETLLVTGYTGIGKSSLVHELQPAVVREGGWFLAGKFDQLERDQPYGALGRAFSEALRTILGESEPQVAGWRQRLGAALGTSARLLMDLMPELEPILGPQPPVVEVAPPEARARFHAVFARFLSVFSGAAQPAVLFLDDLQWADPASLELIRDLAGRAEVTHLLLVCAFRAQELGPSHPVTTTFEAVRRAGRPVRSLSLGPLERAEVERLVADTVRAPIEAAEPLARAIYEKTAGNPFFTLQFLESLEAEGLLAFDAERAAWSWDLGGIQRRGYTDNVIDLMVARLRRVPERTRELVRLAAALGSRARVSSLAILASLSEDEVEAALEHAAHEGFLVRREGEVCFVHDRVEQAAYSLYTEPEREQIHLTIGRRLLETTPPEQLEERIFDIVTHINRGAALITAEEERLEVAALNLRAARRARLATAWESALGYVEAGRALSPSDPWRRVPALTRELAVIAAECCYLIGRFDDASRLLEDVLAQDLTPVERARVHLVQIHLHTTRGAYQEAVHAGLACLELFGVHLPAHPGPERVQAEYAEVWVQLGARRIEELLEAPLTEREDIAAMMEVCAAISAPVLFIDTNLYVLMHCFMTNASLRHGHTGGSALGYVVFGMIIGSSFGRWEEGYRFGKLACDLVERHQLLEHQASTFLTFGSMVSPWTRPLAESLGWLEAAFSAALSTGDLTRACYSCAQTVNVLLWLGRPLDEVEAEAERCLAFARKARFDDIADTLANVLRLARSLRGKTRRFGRFDGDGFEELTHEATLGKSAMGIKVSRYYTEKALLRFLAGSPREARDAAERAAALEWASYAQLEIPRRIHLEALALGALLPEPTQDVASEVRSQIDALIERLEGWAAANPETFGHLAALVKAERASARGEHEAAMRLYEAAIRGARAGGFLQDEALGYERAAAYYQSRGFELFAEASLREARTAYSRWRAEAKVRTLDLAHPRLVTARDGAQESVLALRPEQIDLLSVVKASQTISRELVLERLARTLLEVVLEESGAQRGALLLDREGSLRIEAEASLDETGLRTRIVPPESGDPAGKIPASLINYVRRTKERVVLEDARASRFASDEYVTRMAPRSVLCIPILRRGEAIGVVYLENTLLGGAFSRQSLEVLELLASQAAISVENALFVEREHAARRAAEAAERRTAFLASVQALLSESLDYADVASKLARLATESLADACVIDILDEQGELVRIARAHRDPAREELMLEIERAGLPRRDGNSPAAQVVRSGEPILFPDMSEAVLRAASDDAVDARVSRELGIRTCLAAPLTARGRCFGALTFAAAGDRRYGEDDLRLAADLALRAAVALDNADLYRKAHEAIAAREEFISVASHELYTPITSLSLALQSMRRHLPESAERLTHLVDLSFRQSSRLTRLVGDLLDISRIESGRLPLERSTFDLGELAREVAGRFERDLEQSGSAVNLRLEGQVSGRWDRSRLDQVITNLLANAIKFGRGRPIEVMVRAQGAEAVLEVADQGIGLEPGRQLFQRFSRGVSARNYGGLGLGLYISRSILEAHGGGIAVDSVPGQGATFRLHLPLERETAGSEAEA